MTPRSSLRKRILLSLLGYAVVLSAAVLIQGGVVNEYAERLVWQALLRSELDHFLERKRIDPRYHWADTRMVSLYDAHNAPDAVPAALRDLPPGLHDDIEVDGGERVALVHMADGHRLILTLDLADFEAREVDMTLTVAGSALTTIALLGFLIALGVNRLLQPLSDLALRIEQLQPDHSKQRLHVDASSSAELLVIATALNGYLERNAQFVERERAFVDTTSHELRTPIAVIVGATELGLENAEDPAIVRNQLARIHRTARDVEQLVSLLLVLAKDPARLADTSDRVALEQLLPEIVDDHLYLTRDKDLALSLAPLPPCEIVAPLPIVQAAIGNLLRNAIEHSDRGVVSIALQADATVVIQDPGHGMTPEEISAIYARLARDSAREGGGIGLDLIARLCEHLGWTLDIVSHAGQGTTTTLRLSPLDVV